MILQQGYVWVEEELNGVKTEKYSKVYIFAIPFCGILSVKHEPSETSLDLNSLIESHQHSGWLIGGSIDPIDLSVGDATEVENLDGLILHPLILTVKSDDSTCELSLFLESEDLRTAWKNSIEQLISTLTFLKSCMERDFSPIPSLYQVAHYAVQNHELILHQSALHPKALPTINHFFKLHQMNVLQRIELCDVQLSDQHITALNALLNTCSVRLKSLNLSQNLLTSKGVKLLCASLVTCSNLLALDLSSNLISDSSSACLSETLFQLSRLKRFVIAKNRLSSHSAKSLISRFGNYNSVTEDLDFSYNEIGDDIGFMIAFLFQNVPSVFKSANLACCGLTESSVLEIAKHIPTCASLTHLDISGCMVSAETTRTLMISISRHHVKYSNSSTRLLVRFGGIGVDNDRRSYSLPYQSLRAACFEVTDLTIFQEITLRRLRKLNRIDSFCCFRIESQSWWKNSWMGFLAILRNRLEDRLSTNHRNSLRVLSQTCLCATSHQTAYLFIALLDEDVKKEILTAMKASDSFFRVLNIKSLYLQDSFDGRNSVIENQLITNSGFGGKGFSDHYIPPLAPTDQFHPSFVSDEENIEFDPIMWTIDLPLGEDEIAEEKEEILSQSFSLNVKVEDEVDEGVFTKDYQTMLDYENSMREKRLVNERLVLAVRKLYQAREVSSSVAKFWEGMFGNKKHRSFAEKQLVLAMRLGHDRINDETSMELGLSHLFPSVARREQVYQAMYVRDVEEMQRLHSSLQPSTGGYAVVYSNRLTAEIVSLRQQFHNIQLLAKSYAELPLIEDFLLTCGKLSYTGKEMFEAVELRQKLFAHGMHKGGLSFSEMSTIIKIRSVMTNLLISRDFTALREKIVEWREDEELDVSIFPEISVAENMLNEYDQTMLNLRSAAEKKEIELIDLALSIAAYWNFFSKEVEDCLTVLNDISRNPAHLIRPIVEGLRKGKMSLVDKGFENLLKMGLSHEALDSVVCSKIHALKSRIIQDDSVRDKLVKVCLALKNGFHVAPGEIMQLYRKANAIKLNQDPSLKSYFKILQKHSKKFVSLQKQEKVIQQLIQSNDIYKLSKLLAGRGMGKLVMSFPTAFARDQWYNKFSLVCSGKAIGDNAEILESKDFKEEVVFQGTFEKAARSDDGKLRGWRKRFFLLKSVHLSYYTKVNGEKKGSIRVLNGGARVMEAHEANGKQFCIELEEGRDLSCVSPDLLEEARRHVRFAKIMEIESSLRKGIVLRSVSLLSKMLKFAEELEVMLDYNLMNEAKHSLQTLQVQQLRRDLYFASTTIPRSQILQELSNSANSFMLDPNLSSLKKVRFLLSKSEIEQEIYRCKSSIIHLKSANFLKSMKILTKIDFTQASTKLKSLFLSLILQFVGIRLLDLVQAGVVSFALMKYLKHALVLCHAYHVELEVMDIIRFILKLMTRYIPDIGSPLALNLLTSGSGGTSTSAAMAAPNDLHGLLEELYHFPKISAQYSIAKFPLLRLSSVQNQSSKLFGGFQRRRSSVMDEVMSHSATPIVKSLLKYEVNPLDNNIAVEAFTLLQCLMGEASIASFKKWKKSKILQNPPSHESILYDLLHLVLIRYPVLQDEVYFQLCKQLKLNPNPSSRLHGCWLLSIYLHAFVPSSEAFPYIKNQILQLLVDFSLKAVNGSQEHPVRGAVALESATAMLPTVSLFCQPISVDKVSDFEDQTFAESLANRLCREVCLYSYWLISQAEFYQYSSSSSFLSSSSLKLQKALTQNMDPGHVIRIFQYILSNQRFTFHVILLTGEVITLSLHYAQLTHQSLLVSLYDALFPKSLREYHREVSRRLKGTVDLGSQLELFNEYEGTGQPIKTASNEGEKRGDFDAALAEELWKDIQCAFDGFGFFRLSEAEISSPKVETDQHPRIDFMSIPVQPSFEQFVDWNQDLQWQFLEQYATSSEEMGEFVLGKQNAIVLRRFSMNSIELFTESDYEVFGCEVAETDQIQRCKFWKEWLVSAPNLPVSQSETTFGGANEVLPKDFLRVDLLFSEDTRYVNSRLALMSSESFHYLLAMQLALAWSDSELTGGSNFFSHNSPSVASCYCYTSIDDAINKANSLEKDFNMMSLNASRLEQQQGSSPPENENLSVSDDSEDLNLLAAIDHPQSMLNPLSGRKREDGDESESDYVSSEDELSLDEEIRWKPKPITLTQPMTEEEKDHLQFLLQELGINSEEDMEKSVSDNNLDVNHEQLWRLIGQFHQMPIQLGISVSSPKFRYYLKRAYHHYLVAITGLFYEQYLVNTTFTSLELDESIRNEHIEFQDRYINNFRKMDVLLGLSAQGIYLFSPKDWSIIFYSPYWDVTEYELSTLSHKQKQKRRPSAVGIDEENLRQLVLNISGLKLMFLGGKLDCALEVMNIYSKETLKKGAYPYGTRTNIDELLVINAYNDQHFPQAKVNLASSFSTASSSLAQNNNNTQGNHLFQLFLANYSLLPVPPMIDNHAFMRSEKFFVAPPSQREIIASTRYEEEKLEEEIMKLAEQILLEKNQQQITKGRNEVMHRSLNDEDDEQDEENIQEPVDSTDKEKSSGNLNRNVKLKRKNRSVFQGNRLKSNEEINQILLKDRLDAAVCGVFNKDSIFTQQLQLPTLPFRIKGKVKMPTTNGIDDSLDNHQQMHLKSQHGVSGTVLQLKEFQKKPVIESKRFPFVTTTNDSSLVWSGLTGTHSDPLPTGPIKRHESNVSNALKQASNVTTITGELENLWKTLQKDNLRLATADERGIQLLNEFNEKLNSQKGDSYSMGLSGAMWHHYQQMKDANPSLQPALEESQVDLSQLDVSRSELEI